MTYFKLKEDGKLEISSVGGGGFSPFDELPRHDTLAPDECFYKIVDGVIVIDVDKNNINNETEELGTKWGAIGSFWNSLTVTINGNKYKADEAGTNRMSLKRDALAADATTMWYEDWGSFSTNKVDLQEAITAADTELQAFIDTTMGAA